MEGNFKEKLKNFFKGKTILVTGAAGSIGKALVKKLCEFEVEAIRALDINETGLHELGEELKGEPIGLFIGDVRDKDRLIMAMENVDIVFHAAALKHVYLCEYNPFEAIKTNILGTQNVINAAIVNKVKKVITISTDKAVYPVNVMGTTKLLAEKLTIAANLYKGKKNIAFSVVRFGNVLNSRGSILPTIKKQIKQGGPVTLTHPEMTRFIMSIEDAINLVLKACYLARGGEIFILKMPAVKIRDLIEVAIELLAPKYGYDPKDIEIQIIGKRKGEKLHEELIMKEELEYLKDIGEMYLISPYEDEVINLKSNANFIYSSNKVKLLSKNEIKNLLCKIMKDFPKIV